MNPVDLTQWLRNGIYVVVGLMVLSNVRGADAFYQPSRLVFGLLFISFAIGGVLGLTNDAAHDWWVSLVNTPLAMGLLVSEVTLRLHVRAGQKRRIDDK